jgi:hypothetical protein
MASSFETALLTLRRCAAGLAIESTADQRVQLLAMHAAALELLQSAAPRRRLSTDALVRRVAKLERELHSLPAGERASAIQQRLGISQSRFYQLRKAAREKFYETLESPVAE